MKKNIIYILLIILVVTLGSSYAFFMYRKEGTYSYSFDGGRIDLNFQTGEVIGGSFYPYIYPDDIDSIPKFVVSVTGYNETNKPINYKLFIEPSVPESFSLDLELFKYAIYKDSVLVKEPTVLTSFNIPVYSDIIESNVLKNSPLTSNYQVLLWLRDDIIVSDTFCPGDKLCISKTDINNSDISFKLTLNASR